MTNVTRRSTFAAFAAALIAPVIVPVVARAQGATNAPAGGVPSTTAPSNSQGTPAGGTGVIGGARPSAAPMPATPTTPLVGGAQGTSETTATPHHHRRRHRHRHTTKPSSSTSQ